MKLHLLIHPFLILTITFMIYTGCNHKPIKYIYMPPDATLFTNNVPLPESSVVSIDRVNIELRLNTQAIDLAATNILPTNSAYALSIKEPALIPLEEIQDLHIRPVYDYNSTYAAMDDISETCTYSYSQSGSDSVSKQEMINNFNAGGMYGTGTLVFYIHFSEPPRNYHAQQFIVEIITDKNSRLADTTLEFILTP